MLLRLRREIEEKINNDYHKTTIKLAPPLVLEVNVSLRRKNSSTFTFHLASNKFATSAFDEVKSCHATYLLHKSDRKANDEMKKETMAQQIEKF